MITQLRVRRGTLLVICLTTIVAGCGRDPLATDRSTPIPDARTNLTGGSGTDDEFHPLSEFPATTNTADADTTNRRGGVLIGSGH